MARVEHVIKRKKRTRIECAPLFADLRDFALIKIGACPVGVEQMTGTILHDFPEVLKDRVLLPESFIWFMTRQICPFGAQIRPG